MGADRQLEDTTVSGFLSSLLSDYKAQIARHKNRQFMKGTMAACALVAIADGEVSFSERIRVDQIIDALDALKVFDPHEAVDVFNQFCEGIIKAPKEGRAKALNEMQAAANTEEKAALMVRIFLGICESGGEASLATQIEAVMLCAMLGKEPKDLGLYIDNPAEAIFDRGP